MYGMPAALNGTEIYLAWKSTTDPTTFVLTGAIAGYEQAPTICAHTAKGRRDLRALRSQLR